MLANDADESSRILFDLLILIGHVDMTEGLNEKSAVTLKSTDSLLLRSSVLQWVSWQRILLLKILF